MREHETDDLTTRSAVMVARAAAKPKGEAYRQIAEGLEAAIAWCRGDDAAARLRSLSASDAALARAIDAVPGRG